MPTGGGAMADDPSAESRSSEFTLMEKPSSAARLTIKVGPAVAQGRVPPDGAHRLITTFGILGSAAVGTGGAVLTLSIARTLVWLALAELVLALAAAALIAAAGRANRPDRSDRKLPDDAMDQETSTRGRRSP
jgi:hypothetical protein